VKRQPVQQNSIASADRFPKFAVGLTGHVKLPAKKVSTTHKPCAWWIFVLAGNTMRIMESSPRNRFNVLEDIRRVISWLDCLILWILSR